MLISWICSPNKGISCKYLQLICSLFYLIVFALLISISGNSLAAPVYITDEITTKEVKLKPIAPPSEIFSSSIVNKEHSFKWYKLDIELSPKATHDWLMVFDQVPHEKLDVFVPVNGVYRLHKMGIDSTQSDIFPNVITLRLEPGETKTWFLRHDGSTLSLLKPELWQSLAYFQVLSEQKIVTSSIQTLLIVALIFTFFLTLKTRSKELFLLLSHIVMAHIMILMWQGGFFRLAAWPINPKHWQIMITTLVVLTGIHSYRTLVFLPTYTPKIDKFICLLNILSFSFIVYAVNATGTMAKLAIGLTTFSIFTNLSLITLATAYCFYNGIRPARFAFPLALAILGGLSWSFFLEAWPRTIPNHTELVLLSLHATLLPFIYWYGHQQRFQHTLPINAITYASKKRRIFETALRKHLQSLDVPLSSHSITQKVISVFEEVLPGIPVLLLHHHQNEWLFTQESDSNHKAIEKCLHKQLPSIGDDLLHLVSESSESKINFKDAIGNIYWLFPLDNDDKHKVFLVVVPPKRYRNGTSWQTACDISNHACTLFQANRQSIYWQQQASLDSLTGLLNRRAFYNEAEKITLASINGTGNRFCCALFIDIDNFKQLNDQHGHSIGDQILRTTASICRKELRHDDLLGRYGGEEFVALLPDIAPKQAFQIAERIRLAISNKQKQNNQWNNENPITASIGIAALSKEINSLNKLLDEADKAMYKAKRSGKNRTALSSNLSTSQTPNTVNS